MSSPLPLPDAKQECIWLRYYELTTKNKEPWPTLRRAIDAFNQEGELERTALDLGCGVGTDVAYMVENNWKVTALDAEAVAENFLKEKIPPEKLGKVNFVLSEFEEYPFSEKVKFINASYALPYCSPNHFPSVMERITQAISEGGRFAGHFFGTNDSWVEEPSMTFLENEEEVRKLFPSCFEIELLEEDEYDKQIGSNLRHCHIFEVIAKKV